MRRLHYRSRSIVFAGLDASVVEECKNPSRPTAMTSANDYYFNRPRRARDTVCQSDPDPQRSIPPTPAIIHRRMAQRSRSSASPSTGSSASTTALISTPDGNGSPLRPMKTTRTKSPEGAERIPARSVPAVQIESAREECPKLRIVPDAILSKSKRKSLTRKIRLADNLDAAHRPAPFRPSRSRKLPIRRAISVSKSS